MSTYVIYMTMTIVYYVMKGHRESVFCRFKMFVNLVIREYKHVEKQCRNISTTLVHNNFGYYKKKKTRKLKISSRVLS